MPTLGGKAEIDLPEGTQHGKTFRLRGKGIKGVRSSYPGDLYCHVSVETPVKLTEHQRKLLQASSTSRSARPATGIRRQPRPGATASRTCSRPDARAHRSPAYRGRRRRGRRGGRQRDNARR